MILTVWIVTGSLIWIFWEVLWPITRATMLWWALGELHRLMYAYLPSFPFFASLRPTESHLYRLESSTNSLTPLHPIPTSTLQHTSNKPNSTLFSPTPALIRKDTAPKTMWWRRILWRCIMANSTRGWRKWKRGMIEMGCLLWVLALGLRGGIRMECVWCTSKRCIYLYRWYCFAVVLILIIYSFQYLSWLVLTLFNLRLHLQRDFRRWRGNQTCHLLDHALCCYHYNYHFWMHWNRIMPYIDSLDPDRLIPQYAIGFFVSIASRHGTNRSHTVVPLRTASFAFAFQFIITLCFPFTTNLVTPHVAQN